SNGSRHSSHEYSALQLVDPNRDNSRVFNEPHCGHFTDSANRTGPAATAALPVGAAMPYSASLRLPSSDIQSVVHAGDSTSSITGFSKPADTRAEWMSSRIVSIAGHPE